MNIRKVSMPIKFLKIKKLTISSQELKFKYALVGNPNTGKTTLFNSLTKSNEHVGNWHGVTVEEKEKVFLIENNKSILIDLPGIYSLIPLSYEEEVTTNYLKSKKYDCIINICDINKLRSNLFLTLQLMKTTSNLILFVNTFSSRKNKNLKKRIDETKVVLNKLGIKYFIGNASNNQDINLFKNQLSTIKLNYSDKRKKEYINNTSNNYLKDNTDTYNYINSLFIDNELKKEPYGKSKIDKFLLNKYLALPLFLAVLLLIFYLTFFSLGAFLSENLRFLIQEVIGGRLVGWLREICGVVWIIDLFEVGIIGGVGSVLAFLPQVILLFFFLSLIEDSGYLARVAFLFEDLFSKIGLSGKSVYAILMGFGCSTTAALTARNMEDKNAKIKTAILTPYMSCSAKLPIYAVIGGAFFGASNIAIIFGLYLLGVIVAILVSLILDKKFLKSKEQSFILEFSAYRIPSLKRIITLLWENIKLFLIRIGTVIFSLNIIVWLLQSFSFDFRFVKTQGGVSILQTLGGIFAPIFAPLGFNNWGATAALLAGLSAKEIIVSSIAMFNGINIHGDNMQNQTMRSILDPMSVVCFTPAAALSYMVFCLLYSPCLATISVFKKEIGKKWTAIAIVIQFVLAYTLSLITYNIYKLIEKIGFLNGLWTLIGVVVVVSCICYSFKLVRKKKLCGYCNKNCDNCQKK